MWRRGGRVLGAATWALGIVGLGGLDQDIAGWGRVFAWLLGWRETIAPVGLTIADWLLVVSGALLFAGGDPWRWLWRRIRPRRRPAPRADEWPYPFPPPPDHARSEWELWCSLAGLHDSQVQALKAAGTSPITPDERIPGGGAMGPDELRLLAEDGIVNATTDGRYVVDQRAARLLDERLARVTNR